MSARPVPRLIQAVAELLEFWDNGTPVHPGAEVVTEVRKAYKQVAVNRNPRSTSTWLIDEPIKASLEFDETDPRTEEEIRRTPSLRLDFFLDGIGYQCDVFSDGAEIVNVCRDFGSGHQTDEELSAGLDALYKELAKTIQKWAKTQ